MTSTFAKPAPTAEMDAKLLSLLQGCRLPVPAPVLCKLMDLGHSPDAPPAAYAEVISSSSSLVAKILATVNSSWFGVRHRVSKILQAVNLLGTANVRILAITHCLAATFPKSRLDEKMLDQYWQGGLIKAVAARYVAQQLEPTVSDEAFLSALLQDMALPLMHQLDGAMYEHLLMREGCSPEELCARERRRFGIDHSQAAAFMGQSLGIPEDLCPVLAAHHSRTRLLEVCRCQGLAEAVHVSALLPHVATSWYAPDAEAAARRFTDLFGSSQRDVGPILMAVQAEYQRLSSSVRPAHGQHVDLPELLREAAGEVADTVTGLVGQLHSLMNHAIQMDRELTAVNFEAMQLQEQAQEDPLTGALNRHGLQLAGSARLDAFRQTCSSVMILFVDVDGFKMINDHCGHAQGDELLRSLAHTMRDSLGESALVARYGGDEFVAVVGGMDYAGAQQAIAGLMTATAALPVMGVCGRQGAGISVGALWRPLVPTGATLDELVRLADERMYEAKTRGGCQVIMDPAPHTGNGAGA